MLIQSKAKGISDKLIAKATLLSKQVVYNSNDNTYTVPGSETPHIVTLNPDTCGCKFRGLCSHILAVQFYKEAQEWKQLFGSAEQTEPK